MSQGIFIQGDRGLRRPTSKKEVKELVASDPASVLLERTAWIGNSEHDGPVSEAPEGSYHFVGPDPYTSRKFYGTVTVREGKVKVT